MKVILKPGDVLEVEFVEADGVLTVSFGQDAIRIHTDLPDTADREGLIYEAHFVSWD